jgi:hypothetical protein
VWVREPERVVEMVEVVEEVEVEEMEEDEAKTEANTNEEQDREEGKDTDEQEAFSLILEGLFEQPREEQMQNHTLPCYIQYWTQFFFRRTKRGRRSYV